VQQMAERSLQPPPVEALDAGVIEEARARQRRHRIVAAVLVVALAALGVGAYFGADGRSPAGSSGSRSPAHSGPSATAAATVVFARDPDMGVACHIPSWIGCDRVGLAVWLRRPAVAVSATIAGSPLKLNDPAWSGPLRNGRRTMFAGFLQPAGIIFRLHVKPDDAGVQSWLGSNQPTPTVWFRIDYGHRNVVVTHEDVGLRAGWG
jgi:hypothetical protein